MRAVIRYTGENTISTNNDTTISNKRLMTRCQIGINSGVTCTNGVRQMACCLTLPNTKSCILGMISTVASVWFKTGRMMFMQAFSERSMAMITSSTSYSWMTFTRSSNEPRCGRNSLSL